MTTCSLRNYNYTSGDDINGRPVYRGAWYQYETHLSISPTWYYWAGTINSDPGTGGGYMFSQDRTHRKCPYAATLWKVWVSGGFVMDGSLKVKCTTQCSTAIPSAPAGTVATAWDGQTSVGSNVYYECSASSGSINALCGSDGNWHIIGECSSVSNTTTTPGPTTTTASSCSWTKIYKNFQTITLIATFKGVKRSKDCLQKCKETAGCTWFNWTRKRGKVCELHGDKTRVSQPKNKKMETAWCL